MTSETGKRAKPGIKLDALSGDLQVNVSKDNYHAKAKGFILAHGNEGFVIACRYVGPAKTLTPREWAAWRAYFVRKGVSVRFMDRQGYFTVPAEWPHMFDADATVLSDNADADQAMRAGR